MFKSRGIHLDTQPTPTQQTLMCVLKIAKLLPDGCCFIINSLHNQLAMYKSSFSCREDFFKQPQQPYLAGSKSQNGINSPPPITLCGQRLGGD
jgi:hypothetical protein